MSKTPASQQREHPYLVARRLITTVILIAIVPCISLASISFILSHYLYPYTSLATKAKKIMSIDREDLDTSSHQLLEASLPSITLNPQQTLRQQGNPDLAAYLGSLGSNSGAVVDDLTRQQYYTYNSNGQFITASSMKVPIMLAFLDMLESQGRQIDSQQMNLLTTMIENSNNDSASELYYNEIGGATGITNFMQKVGISGLQPDAAAWGYSLITPQAMVGLLTDLYLGKILTAQDRTLALNLMENVEADQQVGVGDTAPGQATVAMKDGWVTGPDNLWAMNTSGIVITGKETYIIAVFTQEQSSLAGGQAIARKVCSAVATDLA